MEFDTKAQGKDIAEVIGRKETAVKSAENVTLDGLDAINKWFAKHNQSLLESEVDEKDRLKTNIEKEELPDGILTQVETIEGIQTDVNQQSEELNLLSETEELSNNNKKSSLIATQVKNDFENNTLLLDEEETEDNLTFSKLKTKVNKNKINTEEDKDGKVTGNIQKNKKKKGLFVEGQGKLSKATTVSLKTVKTANKATGYLQKRGRSIQTSFNGEVAEASQKELTTTFRRVGGKIVNKATKPIQRSIGRAIMRMMKWLARMLIKLISSLIKLLVSFGPEVGIAAAAIIIVFGILGMFGGSMSDENIESYKTYMTDTQTEYDNITIPYYDQGKIVEGGIEGRGFINWQAAFSIVQGIGAELSYDEAEEYLLKQFKDADLYENIDNVEYTYEKEVVKKDKDGNEYTEVETFTDVKKVITIPSLEDYLEWCNNNFSVIKTFMSKKGMDYDSSATTFTEDQMYLINTLYSSGAFFDLFGEEFSTGYDGGSIIPGGGTGELRYPTYSTTITAGFPNYSNGSYHGGVDFAVPIGTDVCAAEAGTVTTVKRLNTSYGYYVIIDHENGLQTLYAHNSQLFVEEGQKVERGQVIAKSGSTGNSTGPHCHFEVRLNGKQVDPIKYLSEKTSQ